MKNFQNRTMICIDIEEESGTNLKKIPVTSSIRYIDEEER